MRMVACKRDSEDPSLWSHIPRLCWRWPENATRNEAHVLTSSTIKSSDGKGLGSGEQRDMTSCDITMM